MTKELLPYNFKLLYDLNTKEELEHEIDYLLHMLKDIRNLCKDEFPAVVEYIDSFWRKENA